MKRVPIRRVDGIGRDEFVDQHLAGEGAPLIVSRFARQWPAGEKWSLDFFKQAYGADFGQIAIGSAVENGSLLTRLAEFIDKIDRPVGEISGFWVDGDAKPLKQPPIHDPASLWHIYWSSFKLHPELFDDLAPRPSFIPDLLAQIDLQVQRSLEKALGFTFWAIYLGRRNTITSLHRDVAYTHSQLVQFEGRKKAILYAPGDSEWLYRGEVDPERPDFGKFPLLRNATAYEATLEPGDLLFTPSRWWHYTRVVEPSVTLSYNFINEHNLSKFLSCLFQARDGLEHDP